MTIGQPAHALIAEPRTNPDADRVFTPNFVMACVANFVVFCGFHMLIPTLPLYVIELGGREADAGLVIGVFSLTAFLGRPISGWASDVFPRKALLLVGVGVFTASAGFYLAAASIPALLAVRIFHGLGIAAFSTAASVFIADLAPVRRRGEAMGFFGIAGNVALAIAPAIGIALMQGLGFTWLFLVSGALGLLGLVLTSLLSEPPRTHRTLVARPAFRQMLFHRDAVAPATVGFCVYVAWGALVAFLPLFAQRHGVGNPGLFFTVVAVALIGSRAFAGQLSDRHGRVVVLVPGVIFSALGVGLVSQAEDAAVLMLSAAVYGLGLGIVQPVLMALIADRVPIEKRGIGMSTFWVGLEGGITTGSIVFGMVAGAVGLRSMFLLAAFVVLAGLLGLAQVARSGGRRPPKPQSS